jgi:hypothetical protein
MEERILAKRSLGEGHWDRKLKIRLVELSNADTYEEAKHEWIATGRIWWSGNNNVRPEWVHDHAGKCLCGHNVVYHFHIKNTENDNEECVGSDHIGSYLILREIKERLNLSEAEVTEEMIQTWIDVRVQSMIKTAWWHTNGEHFTEMFDKIKEADLRINSKRKNMYWCHTDSKYKYGLQILKRGSGTFGDDDYQMSSIVWRWNHPENSRRQIDGRGYPNDKLWADLVLFSVMYDMKYKAQIEAEDARLEERTRKQHEYNEQYRIRQKQREVERIERQKQHEIRRQQQEEEFEANEKIRKAKLRISDRDKYDDEKNQLDDFSQFNNQEVEEFKNMCDYYGIPAYDGSFPISVWESTFLLDIRTRLSRGQELSSAQLQTLKKICIVEKATEKQINYLKGLGYEEDTSNLSKRIASALITAKNQYDVFEIVRD